MFNLYVVDDSGYRRKINILPKAKNRRERFALWVFKVFAPRLKVVELGAVKHGKKSPLTATEAGNEWITRMGEWSSQRLEDVHVLEFTEDEITVGELE